MYDLIIIGGGPAGLAAALYAARYKLKTVVIAADFGQISKAPLIENYPGVDKVTGLDIAMKWRAQVKAAGVEIKDAEVGSIAKSKNNFKLLTKDSETFESKAVILAMGASHRRLNVEGEEKFIGRGISYCSTCDGPLFKGKVVAVAGGSDSAVMAALHLSEIAKKVMIIYRGEAMRAQPLYVEKAKKKSNVEIITEANVIGLKGDKMIKGIKLDNGADIAVDGLFIEIGQVPSTDLAKQLGIALDKSSYVKVDAAQMTSVPGVFAAGDLTDACNGLKQVLTGASQGAVAANGVFKFLSV